MGEMGKLNKALTLPNDPAPLDRWRFDEALEPRKPIWGLECIAKVLGVSVDHARKLAKDPRVPISQPEGSKRYFAFKSELLAWLRSESGNDFP